MFEKIEKGNIPILSWCPDVEEKCLEQATNLSNHPAITHVALMPDAHMGYGMCIGGVIACKNAVIPNAVGVDIGCGMGYVLTNVDADIISKEVLREMINVIKKVVPTGFNKHKEPQDWARWDSAPDIDIIQENIENASYSLGTLGGGNHFIELQKVVSGENEGKLAIMLHSGSRNLGKVIGDCYNDKAKVLGHQYHSKVDPAWGLDFLPVDSIEGAEYIEAMNFALDFAQESRRLMMERTKNVVFNLIAKRIGKVSTAILNEVNIHHNYASLENHMGKNVWVHRKGAIRVDEGIAGIIPGSQGTASYIVEGLGNIQSLKSASHGAGRKKGRMDASRTITLEEAEKSMEGIVHDRWNKITRGKMKGLHDFGEAPQAYKDIDEVIENEKDLVSVTEKVMPIACLKG